MEETILEVVFLFSLRLLNLNSARYSCCYIYISELFSARLVYTNIQHFYKVRMELTLKKLDNPSSHSYTSSGTKSHLIFPRCNY